MRIEKNKYYNFIFLTILHLHESIYVKLLSNIVSAYITQGTYRIPQPDFMYRFHRNLPPAVLTTTPSPFLCHYRRCSADLQNVSLSVGSSSSHLVLDQKYTELFKQYDAMRSCLLLVVCI